METSVHLSRDSLWLITCSPLIHTGGIIPDRPLYTLLLLLITHAEPCSFYTLRPCPCLLKRLQNVPLCGLFKQISCQWCSDYFQLFDIPSVLQYIDFFMLFCLSVSRPISRSIPRSRISGSRARPFKMLINIAKLLATNCAILQSHKQGTRQSGSLCSCKMVLSNSLDFANLIGHVGLIMAYISFILWENEHFSICLTFFFHYENCLSIFSVHFSIPFFIELSVFIKIKFLFREYNLQSKKKSYPFRTKITVIFGVVPWP